jgi:hypothetical protein
MVHTVGDVEPGTVVAKSEPDDTFGWASRSSILIPEDDRFHDAGDDPTWNESAWWGFLIPELNLMAGVHLHHRPNMNLLAQKVLLWDGNDGRGEEVYDCIHNDTFQVQPESLAGPVSPNNFSSALGVTVRAIEKWKRYAISYQQHGLVMDLEFEAIMPVFSTPYAGLVREWGINSYQQAGRMTGTIRLHGTEVTVDGPAHRDRSWGPRNFADGPEIFLRHQWQWAVSLEGSGLAVNLTTVADLLPREEVPDKRDTPFRTPKPEFGPERVTNGLLYRDGIVSRVVEANYDVLERRSDGLPSEVAMRGTDELGREFSAHGVAKNYLKRCSPPGIFASCSLVEWAFEDGHHAWGQLAEVLPQDMGRRFFRTLPPTLARVCRHD